MGMNSAGMPGSSIKGIKMKAITIRLTPKQAGLVWGILDGAADAGACEDGLTRAEHVAVGRVIDQILSQTGKYPSDTTLRERIADAIEGAGFSFHSEDEDKIIGAVLSVIE